MDQQITSVILAALNIVVLTTIVPLVRYFVRVEIKSAIDTQRITQGERELADAVRLALCEKNIARIESRLGITKHDTYGD